MESPDTPSLLSSEPSEITSYDIPLQTRAYDRLYTTLPQIGTTSFINGTIDNQNERRKHLDDHDLAAQETDMESSVVSHGFFLGKESIQDLSLPTLDTGQSGGAFLEDDDDTEDEGISEIYRLSRHDADDTSWIRQSDRSFKSLTPESTPRHVLSQRIGTIGGIGQKIGLGHRLGVLTEDSTLIPKRVHPSSTHFLITEQSPVQIDLNWSRPDNASMFATLIYKIEVCHVPGNKVTYCTGDEGDEDADDNDEWMQLADVRHTTFRVYHTEDKLFVGRLRYLRRKDDVIIKLRVLCRGELVLPDGKRHWTVSNSYSKTMEVTFEGYDKPIPVEPQQTKL